MPLNLWPELFKDSNLPLGSTRDPFHSPHIDFGDLKRWDLTVIGNFSIKSFYGFVNDKGVRCQVTLDILKGLCPLKTNLFNGLAWDNRILTHKNLARRRCSSLLTMPCVLCRSASKSAGHLLLRTTNFWLLRSIILFSLSS